MEKTVLTIKDLTKDFGKVRALDKINLELHEGETFGYIGPNGAGKTTTIRILLGSLKATSGSASVFSLDSWKDSVEIHKRIAYVPGELNLWKNMTGGEVIDLLLSLHGVKDLSSREKYLKIFDLDPLKKCGTYSKGNRQKIALVAAFASDADLLILDEPTNGLDPLMEQVFIECIEEEKKKGKTILLSSHILSEVERICDHIGIINNGKIVETGSLDELRHLSSNSVVMETRLPADSLNDIKGISDLVRDGNRLSFHADSQHTEEIISHLSKYGITKLTSTPATLEDLFLRHYHVNQED